MPNLAGEYWATDGGAGTKTGLSLANAAAIDPNDANDLWTIINAGTVISDVIINLCVDGTVSIAATGGISKDGTSTYRIVCQGRYAADTADARVVLDAGGGAFSVFTLTICDFWTFKDLAATNTNRASGNDGWNITSSADDCTWIRCEGNWCYNGFDLSTGSSDAAVYSCLAHNNANHGLNLPVLTCVNDRLVAHNNGGIGITCKGRNVRPISYDNGSWGILVTFLSQGVAFRNGSTGIRIAANSYPGLVIDCISVSNAEYGFRSAVSSYSIYMSRCADYDNTSGRVDSTGTLIADEGDPGLSADPFVEAAPKYELAAGAAGCTAVDNGGESNLEDLNNGSWGGSVAVDDRIRFFSNSTQHEDALETVVTAISVGGDDDIITVSPQVTAGTQKQCWLGGGNFALNDTAGGGTLCRNTAGRSTTDGWSTDYLDIGAVQHLEAGAAGGLAKLAGMGGGLVG